MCVNTGNTNQKRYIVPTVYNVSKEDHLQKRYFSCIV